jgi:dihydrofolate synthase / folylpolyglutamate synthase
MASRYEETLAFLYHCHATSYYDLRRIRRVLDYLGNPHQTFPSVLIAGTNGKGSVAKMLNAVLRQAGYRVGCFTSPHLLDFGERITVDDRLLSHAEIVALTDEIKTRALAPLTHDAPELGPVSFFEIVTAMGLLHFARQSVDIAILEVGIGGRLDATNTVEPLVSVITNVGLDHQNFLGNTIAAIAQEKSGIIRPHGEVVTGSQHPEALAVIESVCRERHAACYRVDALDPASDGNAARTTSSACAVPRKMSSTGSFFDYHGLTAAWEDVYVRLSGAHQVLNASVALCAAELLDRKGFRISEQAARSGLARVEHPGRLEVLRANPFCVVDIAHNEMGARTIAAELPDLFAYDRLIVVVGILHDKDVAAILRPFLRVARAMIFTSPHLTERAESASTVAAIAAAVAGELHGPRGWRSRYQHWEVCESVESALTFALSIAGPRDVILATGSNYTVSEVEILCRGQGNGRAS